MQVGAIRHIHNSHEDLMHLQIKRFNSPLVHGYDRMRALTLTLLSVAIVTLATAAHAYPAPYNKSLRLRSVGVTGTTLDGYAGNPYSWTVNDVNPYQYWAYYIRPYKSGFQLMNMGTKKCLDGYRGVDNSVVHPYQWECNAENTYQYWIFAAEGPKPGYLVRNAATGLCLEASPLGGAVTQKPCDNTNSNQKWWM